MDNDAVMKTMNAWYDATEDAGKSVDGYQFLRLCLPRFLADDAMTGLALQSDTPVIVALTGRRLLSFQVTNPGGEQEEPQMRVGTVALGGSTGAQLWATIEHRPPQASFLARWWTLISAGSESLLLKTEVPLGRYSSHYLEGDKVMVAAAEFLDWPSPDSSR